MKYRGNRDQPGAEESKGFSTPSRRGFLQCTALWPALFGPALRAGETARPLDPRGRIHIPIGIANTLDTLKTFVEAEGNFSPGFGSYGVYFWVYDRGAERLVAPTMQDVACAHGLHKDGYLIPWAEWSAEGVQVRTEVCHVQRSSAAGPVHVVAARVRLRNRGTSPRRFTLYTVLRPVGPAGFDLHDVAVSEDGEALLVEGRPAVVAMQPVASAGVLAEDTTGELALSGKSPVGSRVHSEAGDCSGALLHEVELSAGESRWFHFVCPVLPGRRAARHQWADLKQEAMVDVAPLNPQNGGILQPDPGLDYCRGLDVAGLFQEAEAYWRDLTGPIEISVPDPRWRQAARAIIAHASLCMNEGAPDVAVINYNVFNRDGSYVANIFQKAGLFQLSEAALDYFLAQPFNGRAYPEADNPGQILWAMGQQWLFTRDQHWLRRVYPAAAKIAAMIEYCRTRPGPHWVNPHRLDFGEALPPERREELKPGRCDGFHPEYTEAFDIAGLRAAAVLAKAAGKESDSRRWSGLSDRFFESYDQRFGGRLTRDYGSYSVLWPCQLYPASSPKARTQFGSFGAQKPTSWRYFPLATAHQGLLAGNREAGYGTLSIHLEHEQMRGWFAFDEGGGSDSGGWYRARTTWPHNKEKPGENLSVAMPHGWAIAELWLLMRDSLVHEDGDQLVLLAGVAAEWFRHAAGMRAEHLRTHFGELSLEYQPGPKSAKLELSGDARPPRGYSLALPSQLAASVSADGRAVAPGQNGAWNLPGDARKITLVFAA